MQNLSETKLTYTSAGKPISFFGDEPAIVALEEQFGSHLQGLTRAFKIFLATLLLERSYYWNLGRKEVRIFDLICDRYQYLDERSDVAAVIADTLSESGAISVAAFLIDDLRLA